MFYFQNHIICNRKRGGSGAVNEREKPDDAWSRDQVSSFTQSQDKMCSLHAFDLNVAVMWSLVNHVHSVCVCVYVLRYTLPLLKYSWLCKIWTIRSIRILNCPKIPVFNEFIRWWTTRFMKYVRFINYYWGFFLDNYLIYIIMKVNGFPVWGQIYIH